MRVQQTRKIVTKNSNPRPNSNCKQNRNDIPEKRNCGNEIKSCLPTIKTNQPRFRIFIPLPPWWRNSQVRQNLTYIHIQRQLTATMDREKDSIEKGLKTRQSVRNISWLSYKWLKDFWWTRRGVEEPSWGWLVMGLSISQIWRYIWMLRWDSNISL